MSSDMFDANTTVNGRDTGCHTIVQLSISTILQFNGVLSLFTTGSNTTALPDTTGIVVGSVTATVVIFLLVIAEITLILHIRYRKLQRQATRRGWCTCMSCTCKCRSYYFVMWACWIHAQASLQLVNLKVNIAAA